MSQSEKKSDRQLSVFETLNNIDAAQFIQQKGQRRDSPKYIAWALAWREVKKCFPDASYEIIKSQDYRNYHHDQRTAWVEVVVNVPHNVPELGDERHHVHLPIMDNRNASIPVEKLTSFDVNSSIMRALVKGLALAGFGIDMWIKDEILDRLDGGEHTDSKEAMKKSGAKSGAKTAEKGKPSTAKAKTLELLTKDHADFNKVLNFISENRGIGLSKIVDRLAKRYDLKEVEPELSRHFNNQNTDSDE